MKHSPALWNIENGWVTLTSSKLLLWLHNQHRIGFWSPYNTVIIGQQQTQLSYENFVYGTEWDTCYAPIVCI
ncbi:hypothetical protein B0H15DRAFT_791836 [Mycena belliarum]|uniref:Uncharacterized protein n=1 Tax=Mycena belliarum TaxID=1033014 RepID=A0AAD6TU24_9AGAR|nr:hypothetical protein B0H15DRAFT_791836 [Mycena belliae]